MLSNYCMWLCSRIVVQRSFEYTLTEVTEVKISCSQLPFISWNNIINIQI